MPRKMNVLCATPPALHVCPVGARVSRVYFALHAGPLAELALHFPGTSFRPRLLLPGPLLLAYHGNRSRFQNKDAPMITLAEPI